MLLRTGVKNTVNIYPPNNLPQEDVATEAVYSVFLTQTSTNAPVANILLSTITALLTWSYVSKGVYKLSIPGGFTIAKTIITPSIGFLISLQTTNTPNTPPVFAVVKYDGSNNLLIETIDANFSPANDILTNFPLKIEIYP